MLPDGDASLVCATCGRALDGVDADEEESGDAGLPICGECARERDFFDIELELRDAQDEADG